MTVNNNRPTTNTTATTTTTTTTSPSRATASEGGAVESLPSSTPAAATFEAARTPRAAPFGPPSSPKLIDERTALSPSDRERIRDENTARIKGYNEQYGAYLETYTAGVESAPTLDRVKKFGAPVAYAPAANLPVDQRARYDELQKPALANQKIVHEAIGERVLKDRGEKVPGFYGFFEGKTGMFGQTAKERFELHGDGTMKAKTALGFSVSTPVETPIGKLKASVTIDPDTGKAKTALATKIGAGEGAFVGLEVDSDAKLSLEFGVRKKQHLLGQDGEVAASVGSSWDPTAGRAETFGKVGAKVGDFEVEVKAGVGAQLLTKEYVKQVIDPDAKGFFDDDKIMALRNSGR